MEELLLDQKVLALRDAFVSGEIPHAFGGAIALAYYATPRGTVDINVNVFVPPGDTEKVFLALSELDVDTGGAEQAEEVERSGQAKVRWKHTPIDLFFSTDPLHDSCLERRRAVPFGGDETIHVLSAEDLVIFKVLFDRRRDWGDIEEVLCAVGPRFDASHCLRWLERILDRDDSRLGRFEEALRSPML